MRFRWDSRQGFPGNCRIFYRDIKKFSQNRAFLQRGLLAVVYKTAT